MLKQAPHTLRKIFYKRLFIIVVTWYVSCAIFIRLDWSGYQLGGFVSQTSLLNGQFMFSMHWDIGQFPRHNRNFKIGLSPDFYLPAPLNIWIDQGKYNKALGNEYSPLYRLILNQFYWYGPRSLISSGGLVLGFPLWIIVLLTAFVAYLLYMRSCRKFSIHVQDQSTVTETKLSETSAN